MEKKKQINKIERLISEKLTPEEKQHIDRKCTRWGEIEEGFQIANRVEEMAQTRFIAEEDAEAITLRKLAKTLRKEYNNAKKRFEYDYCIKNDYEF